MCVYVLRVFVCEFYVCYSLPLHRHCAEPGGYTNLTFSSVCVCVCLNVCICVACVCVRFMCVVAYPSTDIVLNQVGAHV
jgi:hypothetical protein